jgi:trimeric autotransporter adhesin
VSDPPASAVTGASFPVTITVENTGDAGATAASTTRYFLSTDRQVGDDARFTATTVVPPLGIGGSDTQVVVLTIPGGVAPGSYFVVACADRTKVVPKLDDRNNCSSAAGAVAVTGADLVAAPDDPPASIEPGALLFISDTVRNEGSAPAASSAVGYYLSATPTRGPDAYRLPARQTGPIAAGGASSITRKCGRRRCRRARTS